MTAMSQASNVSFKFARLLLHEVQDKGRPTIRLMTEQTREVRLAGPQEWEGGDEMS
jgi:hypothetical protein